MITAEAVEDWGVRVDEALERAADEVRNRLVAIQAELDEIGPTFGMQWQRNALNREKNELLDQLLGLRCLLQPAA